MVLGRATIHEDTRLLLPALQQILERSSEVWSRDDAFTPQVKAKVHDLNHRSLLPAPERKGGSHVSATGYHPL